MINKEYTMNTELWADHWTDEELEEVSSCCGAEVYDDYDICSECNDHCGREEAEQ
jgi:hypothetical protein|tara:strand:- start:708 stop:872 length:165 start_codon:yes stop_codon:yes gene_type:complete